MNPTDKEINFLITTLSSFVKDVVTSNVAEAKQRNMVKIDDAEVRKLISIIGSSVDQAVSRANPQIEATKKNLRG